jgi:hypothetical protein
MDKWINLIGFVLGTLFAWFGILVIEPPTRRYLNPDTFSEKLIYLITTGAYIIFLAVLGNLIIFELFD